METTHEQFTGFVRHLKILQALSDKSVRSYRTKVEEFFAWYRGKISQDAFVFPDDIQKITRQDVEAYLEWCYYKGNGNQTRFTKLIALQKYFRYLVYEGTIKEDIIAMIPRPKIARTFVQKFTKEDVLNFFRAVNITIEKGIRDMAIFIFGAFCGLRVSEIINLNLNDIIDDGQAIDINVIDSKHNSNRVVYLWKAPSLFIRQWLSIRLSQGAKAGDPFLVSYRKGGSARGDGERLSSVAIDKLVKKYAKVAAIRRARVHVHMFRATHASDLRFIRGYDIAAIAQRLGHKHISSTDRYLPSRDRIRHEYHSLAEYWQEFTNLWTRKEKAEDVDRKSETYGEKSEISNPQSEISSCSPPAIPAGV